jgi:hypothetical protein
MVERMLCIVCVGVPIETERVQAAGFDEELAVVEAVLDSGNLFRCVLKHPLDYIDVQVGRHVLALVPDCPRSL